MDAGRLLTVIGAGIATFLVTAVLVIELLDFEFSAIVGLPVGLVAGLAVAIGLARTYDDLDTTGRRAASAYAAFGLAVVALLALRYGNVGPSRSLLSVDAIVGLGLAAAALTYVGLAATERRSRPAR